LDTVKQQENRDKLGLDDQTSNTSTDNASTSGKKKDKKDKKDKDSDVVQEKTIAPNEISKAKNKEIVDELFRDTFAKWNESMEILERIERVADDTQAVGTAALEKLNLQTEQLRAIDQGLDDLQSNIKRARTEIASFARGVARQKCIFIVIIGVCLMVLLIVIAVIVWLTCTPCKQLVPKINIGATDPANPVTNGTSILFM